MTQQDPLWQQWELPEDYLGTAVQILAQEGVKRLLLDPTQERRLALEDLLSERHQPSDPPINSLVEAVRTEAIEIAARLGFALAQTVTLGDFEGWLQAAIRAAGLERYAPPAKLLGDGNG